jgi:hypothetical protein
MKWDEYILLREDYVAIGYGPTPADAVANALSEGNSPEDIQRGCVYKAWTRCAGFTPHWDHLDINLRKKEDYHD